MVTKGIILGRESGNNKYTIRLPLLETSATTEPFTIKATSCISDGVINPYCVGDVVYIAFENNEYDEPVIIGKLALTGLNGAVEGVNASYKMNSLEVLNSAKLPTNTNIGEISYKQLLELFNKVNNSPDIEVVDLR